MEVNVQDRLTCGLPHIHSKIKAVGLAFPNQRGACFICEREKIMTLLGSRFERIGDVTPR
jgi:hypothetical protein